jgi:RNA polymerase sigma-70 factor (ECF subfamily)
MQKKPDNRDEAAMITSILAGETRLYHELIRPYERSVYRMALSFVKNEADAEDVVQEAFLKAFSGLARFRFEASFSTWLISITLNEARTRLRRNTASRTQSLDESEEEGGTISPALLRDWREIPSEVMERHEVRDILRQAVDALPVRYRQVLVLRELEDLSTDETAALLEITAANVKVRLHRARIMLQKQLAPQLKKISPETRRRWLPWF